MTEQAVAHGAAPAVSGAPRLAFEALDLPLTGDARVDEVLTGLGALAGAPVSEHVAVYDAVHRGLRDCLADLEPAPAPAPAPAGSDQPRPSPAVPR